MASRAWATPSAAEAAEEESSPVIKAEEESSPVVKAEEEYRSPSEPRVKEEPSE